MVHFVRFILLCPFFLGFSPAFGVLAIAKDFFTDPPDEQAFIRDALNDASTHYSLLINSDPRAYRFSIYEAYQVDFNQDDEPELVVAGSLSGQIYHVVMAYYKVADEWKCQVLNRSVGGGISDLKILDLDNDGLLEVFSVLQDRDLKRSCTIFHTSSYSGLPLSEMFCYRSKGGLTSSHNFSVFRPKNSGEYSLRIDEMIYPENEDGDVQQTTYIYKIVKNQWVLDKTIKGGTHF